MIAERIQYAPLCDWCRDLQVGFWDTNRRLALRTLAKHRRHHRAMNRIGQSIRSVDIDRERGR